MSPRELVGDVLLVAGAAWLLVAALGLLLRRDVRDRIHYAALAAMVGAPLVVVALAVTADGWQLAVKLLVIAALIAGTGPVLSSVTGRAVERSTGAAHPTGGPEEVHDR